MLLRRAFEKKSGSYQIKHMYYQSGESKTVMMNWMPMWDLMRHDGRSRLEFTQTCLLKGDSFDINLVAAPGHKPIEKLSPKMISKLGLDSRKTWFGTLDKRMSISSNEYKHRKFIALVGFRRVPRKWVPELNALLIKDDK
jgi:hypothetical protein